jgi:hypothetical protein
MNNKFQRAARIALVVPILAGVVVLSGCIDSAKPLFTDAQPLIGARPRLQLFALRDGAAHDPDTETFRWRDGRYVPIGGTVKNAANELGDFTLHAFEGADLILQSTRPGHATEYAIARRIADGTYLSIAIDENDADESTRSKYCNTDANAACRVATREAVLAFAHATAAKPHSTGGLAVLLAEH